MQRILLRLLEKPTLTPKPRVLDQRAVGPDLYQFGLVLTSTIAKHCTPKAVGQIYVVVFI